MCHATCLFGTGPEPHHRLFPCVRAAACLARSLRPALTSPRTPRNAHDRRSTVYGHDPSKASMLWTWSRASNGGGATSMALYKDNEAAKGGVTHYNLDGTITSEDDNDFYLWQVGL